MLDFAQNIALKSKKHQIKRLIFEMLLLEELYVVSFYMFLVIISNIKQLGLH
jgi:hypothetical protein